MFDTGGTNYTFLHNLDIAILSIVVYPMSVALPYGIYRVYKTINDREIALRAKIIKVIFQMGYIIFSMLFLNMIFSYPHITLSYIIYFLSIQFNS